MYTDRYQVLSHRCELGCFPLSQWPGWVEYDVTMVKNSISPEVVDRVSFV